ncbi:MAG TPA: hypothetical protein DCK76_09260 [Desulfotomaculum sp.]|nr:MAG: Flagellar hook capping protein [Desulfotomaculum sp. 46_80]HAG11551.1 hypothetical protein [Desulfotomaculum sp.]HBY03745.1 hypothetical protein [Desulfotomaculum sp.]
MSVSSISNENSQQSQTSQSRTSFLDKDSFLKLMVAQLVNQDPFNTQDSGQFLTQLAQVTQLEQMINLNDKLTNLVQGQVYTQAVSLIGLQVKVQDSNGKEVEGTVSKVAFQNDRVSVVIDEVSYPLSAVIEVSNGEEVDGTVSKAAPQNDEASIVIEEGTYPLTYVVEATN